MKHLIQSRGITCSLPNHVIARYPIMSSESFSLIQPNPATISAASESPQTQNYHEHRLKCPGHVKSRFSIRPLLLRYSPIFCRLYLCSCSSFTSVLLALLRNAATPEMPLFCFFFAIDSDLSSLQSLNLFNQVFDARVLMLGKISFCGS